MAEIVAPGIAADESDHAECAHESEGIGRCVKKRGAEAIAAAGDEAEQGIAGMRDCRIGEEAANVGLSERDKVADKNGQSRQNGKKGRPTCDHGMPASGSLCR